ncbi:C-terminal domain of CHU protein family protein [Algoriphagus halophilus]|uniref:C-terminal domain of CHU protein family protein n=1 Tax=Algoriphagus halophilus TaxID=226505 RepID=A0A1N6H2Q2_9BACT|nr:C-terminal domain of CHU protein family protein [Algoriphagus halophilus]
MVSGSVSIAISDFFAENLNPTNLRNQKIQDPELIGPDKLCNVYGSVIGDFFGAGNPQTDVYLWKIFNPTGQLVFDKSGGESFQTISYTFDQIGTHRVELIVRRPGVPDFSQSQDVELIKGPTISLLPAYEICDINGISISAIDENSSEFTDYEFIWEDGEGNVIGDSNTITVVEPDRYTVTFFFEDEDGNQACETSLFTDISLYEGYEIESSTPFICPDNTVTLTTSEDLNGSWYFRKLPNTDEIFLDQDKSIVITPILDLDMPGEYEIIFKPNPVSGNNCLIEKTYPLTYYPQPDYEVIDSKSSSNCLIPDGSITIRALTPLDKVFLEESGESSPPLNPGETYEFTNLKSGAYTLTGVLGGCLNYLGSVVSLATEPDSYKYDIQNITGEACTAEGKINGSIKILFPNGPVSGSYRLINEKGTLIRENEVLGISNLEISIPGGQYYFEFYGEDECRIPRADLIDVPGLEQTDFSVPEILTVCQSFELFPESNQLLDYQLQLPDGTTEYKSNGEPFVITQAGPYKITGLLPNQSEVCPSTLEFEVTLVDPVDFKPVLIKQDCFGNRTYFADISGVDPSAVIFSWYNENDELIGTGQTMFPTSFGEFKLDVQPSNSAACPIPPKSFLIEEPILEVDVSMETTKLCELGPGATISIETTFPDEVTDILWRRYTSTGIIEELDQFKDETEITVFEDGTYEASVYSIIPTIEKDCELGRNSIDLTFNTEKVEFSVPDSLSICQSFDLIPETDQPLQFILTLPDGSTVEKDADNPFELTQEGNYSLFGYHPEISSPNCPVIKDFYVKVNQPIPFEPILFSEDCNGEKTYQAKLTGASAEDVLIFWFDEDNNLLSTDEFISIGNSEFGNYYLEVQPRNSEPCDLEPILFEVKESVLSLEVSLLAAPLCPEATDAAISIEADLDLVNTIEWWFTDLNGNQTQLTSQKNMPEILASEEGTYEARLYNNVPCLVGSDLVLLTRSMDQVRPEVDERYQICPRYEIAPVINPGSFASYEWYHEGNLVSTSPNYKPLLVGNFELVVYSEEGCAYSTNFETIEECELRVTYPNAIELDNPDKGFLVYTNYLIDELEVFIFNQWGQMVFNCKQTDLIKEESTCFWDGTYNGKKIPNGAYSIRLNYVNLERGITDYQIGSILVIN